MTIQQAAKRAAAISRSGSGAGTWPWPRSARSQAAASAARRCPATTSAPGRCCSSGRARGYRPAVDDIANLFVRRSGRDAGAAPVVAGSHMDSQPAGGQFDGIFGVLAGLEALEALDDAGIATMRPIDVVAWTNEEVVGSPPAPWARRCSPDTCGWRTVSH